MITFDSKSPFPFNEWLCRHCKTIYATSAQMSLEEARECYEEYDCPICRFPVSLVARYTPTAYQMLLGQLPLWGSDVLAQTTTGTEGGVLC